MRRGSSKPFGEWGIKLKSKVLKRFALRVLIYSAVYVLCAVLIDQWLNGWLMQWLYDHLPFSLYIALNENRWFYLCLPYTAGLLVLSVITILHTGRLLGMAEQSLQEDSPLMNASKVPEELRDFHQKIQSFYAAQQEAEQARQLAEQQKNDLIVYMAHDLKTPLTSVIGYVSLLEETPDLPPAQRAKYAGIALDKAYRLEQLINEFFEITRMNLQTPQTQCSHVNVTRLLLQVLEEFHPMLIKRELTVEHRIAAGLTAYADADKLARVFDNLFRNAVSYSHSGTVIYVNASAQNGQLIVSVCNQGDDIPAEKLERLFDKFYRGDSARRTATGGSGLGLAFAKQIIELHGGTIRASCIRGWTELKVTLPM